jgi:hypothetical protein
MVTFEVAVVKEKKTIPFYLALFLLHNRVGHSQQGH